MLIIWFNFNLYANTTSYRITAIINEQYKLNILDNNFSKVVDMNPGSYLQTFNGQNCPNLENVESVFIIV